MLCSPPALRLLTSRPWASLPSAFPPPSRFPPPSPFPLLPQELAYKCLSKLGLVFDNEGAQASLGVIQFKDLNMNMTSLQRCQRHRIFESYAKELKRLDKLERTLDFFNQQLARAKIEALEPVQPLEEFLHETAESKTNLLDEVKVTMEGIQKQLAEREGNIKNLTRERTDLMELAMVLEKEADFIDDFTAEEKASGETKSDAVGLLASESGGQDDSMRFIRFMAGVIADEDKERFKRAAYRVTRGNFLPEFREIGQPLLDPSTDTEVNKSVFIIIYQDDEIEEKLTRLCDAFGATVHDVPDLRDKAAISAKQSETWVSIRDRDTQINGLQERSRDVLRGNVASFIVSWKWHIRREKAIYRALNMFTPLSSTDTGGSMLMGEGWVLKEKADQCEQIIRTVGQQAQGASICNSFKVPEHEWRGTPPTFFRTNKVTSAFQAMIDTYGVPRYREANPALSTVITFPFLFGVMYGDIGHSLVLFCAALFFIVREESLKKANLGEIVTMAFEGRYMLVMMGAFGVYMGFIYNDIFSLTLNCFGSKWTYGDQAIEANREATHATALFGVGNASNVYAFGMDPQWHNSENELMFFNSFKMKMSVIIGVSQMFFGLCMRTMNQIHYKNWVELFNECIPMIMFMLSLFGYMIFLIFYKWTQPWDTMTPPSLINTMIAILLQPGCPAAGNASTTGCQEPPVYEGQAGVQLVLLGIAGISVPWLLFAKPCILGCCCKPEEDSHGDVPQARMQGGNQELEGVLVGDGYESKGDDGDNSMQVHDGGHGDDGSHEDHGFGTLMIHQAIETIEYVLGVISNTASYLRLWALSLAHAELALVFWEKTMLMTISMNVRRT